MRFWKGELTLGSMRSGWKAGVLIVLVVIAFSGCSRQVSSTGRLQNNTYVNDDLHFTYSWPSMLQPVPIESLNLNAPNPNPSERLLFASRQGAEPYGVVMISEKLHIPTKTNPHGFENGADFLGRIGASAKPGAQLQLVSRKHVVLDGGIIADEVDYSEHGEEDAGVTLQIDDNLVVFKCNAKSTADLKVMTDSILGVRRTK